MVTDYVRARNVLKERLDAVFASDAFAELYGVRAPRVFLGFPASEPPFYAAVDEIVDASAASGGATMGHAQVDFTLHVWLCAQHADLVTASDTLLAYVDAVFASVLADPQLCDTVDNSFPQIDTAGTAADSSKRYIAAASVAVACTVWATCPHLLSEVVGASNDEIREGQDEGDGDQGL